MIFVLSQQAAASVLSGSNRACNLIFLRKPPLCGLGMVGGAAGCHPHKGRCDSQGPSWAPQSSACRSPNQVDPVCVRTNRCLGLGDGQRAEAGVRDRLGLGGTGESQGRNIAHLILGINPYLCFPEASSCLRRCQRQFRDLVPSLGSKQVGVLTSLGLHLHVPYCCFVPQNTPTGSMFSDKFSP